MYSFELKKSGNEESEEYINLKLYQNRLTTTINTNIKKWELETPKQIRANAVDDVVKAYETGFSQLQSGLISYFNMYTQYMLVSIIWVFLILIHIYLI